MLKKIKVKIRQEKQTRHCSKAAHCLNENLKCFIFYSVVIDSKSILANSIISINKKTKKKHILRVLEPYIAGVWKQLLRTNFKPA